MKVRHHRRLPTSPVVPLLLVPTDKKDRQETETERKKQREWIHSE